MPTDVPPERSRQPRELSLFSGAGGGLLATKHLLGWRTVGYVEWDEYCQRVLQARIADGLLDDAPIFGNIREFKGSLWRGHVDVVTAGFPCQPFSVAGKQDGANDSRNLWPETIRVIREVTPNFIMLENVPGIRRYLPVVIRDLRRSGYVVKRPLIVAAAAVGAGHIRRRVWIYAYLDEARQENNQGITTTAAVPKERSAAGVGDAQISADANQARELQSQGGWWEVEPDMVRVVYGIPNAMDRIGALGNGQIPLVAATAWRLLTEFS